MLGSGLVWALLSALELSAPEAACPEVNLVRLRLRALGVDLAAREGRARWTHDGERVRLQVETGTTAVAERSFAAPSCAELAEQLALAIERATAPLGVAPAPPPPPLPDPEDSERLRYEVALGPRLRAHQGLGAGLELSALLWLVRGSLGAELALGAGLPDSAAVRTTSLEVQRSFLSIGPAGRLAVGGGVDAGLVASAALELVRVAPAGVVSPETTVDLRGGLRTAAYLGRALGPLSLRLSLELELWGGERRYRAIPATDLVTLGVVGLHAALLVGWAGPEP